MDMIKMSEFITNYQFALCQLSTAKQYKNLILAFKLADKTVYISIPDETDMPVAWVGW